MLPVHKKQHKVRKFNYNGFHGKLMKGFAPYTAIFNQWSDDPGIAICSCSDGKKRYIPSFALDGVKENAFPKQGYTGGKAVFGLRCDHASHITKQQVIRKILRPCETIKVSHL